LLSGGTADARLAGKAWKAAETLFGTLFAQRGNPAGKRAVLATIAEDASGRAWRLMADGLFKEVVLFDEIMTEFVRASSEHGEIMQRGIKGFTADDENRAKTLQARLTELDAEIREERAALAAVVEAVSAGPEILRKNILQRAKTGAWTARAAAVRVSVETMSEKASRAYLLKTIAGDKDPRVRMAGLDALGRAKTGWEALVIGRIADPDWPVQLRAVAICRERKVHKAVPHLINALTGARPRVAEALGVALRELTGENFEPYADVWGKWWADHAAEFKSDVAVKKGSKAEFAEVKFYGVPIKSDRILFIIDVSGSMKLETKNDNPAARYKPPPPVTGRKGPPPPPPPEDIPSGPKIDVAKHELKKAIKRLPKGYTFNIIAFNQGAEHWQPTMMKATKKNKQSAYQWMRKLKPHGSTYIDGALRMGFKIAGLLNYDKRYPDISLDTIVLLSDGAPTNNSFPVSKKMDPQIILDHVREWNVNRQVVIHCIGVDMVDGIQFLKDLAKENGGTYVDR